MCKLMLAIGVKNNTNLKKFCRVSSQKISISNNDGFGYIAVKGNKEIFGQRWLDNSEAFLDPKDIATPAEVEQLSKLSKLGSFVDTTKIAKAVEEKTKKGVSNFFGQQDWGQTRSVLMHARMKTNGDVEIKNTHPFMNATDTTGIVHNGMIYNHEEFKKISSTCDSEVILRRYMEHKLNTNPQDIQNMIDELRGYWAVGATSLDAEGNRIIDVFTTKQGDGGGGLCAMYCDELGGYVFCTSDFSLKAVLKDLGWKENPIVAVNNYTLTRFNAVTGDVLEIVKHSESVLGQNRTTTYNNYGRSSSNANTPSGKGSSTGTTTTTTSSSSQTKTTNAGASNGSATNRSGSESGMDDSYDYGSYCSKLSNFYMSVTDDDCMDITYPAFPQSQDKSVVENAIDNIDLNPSDSKYAIDGLSDEAKRELDEFATKLSEDEQTLLEDFPDDIKYKVLELTRKEMLQAN